jgi:hypothetical protein
MTAAGKSTLRDRLAAMNWPRPNFDHLNDPGLWARIGLTDAVEDDGEVAEPVQRRRRRQIVLDAVDPDKPITLATAERLAFPDGGMTISGLRNEIAKGNLRASKMSGQIYVTMNDITRMMERCTIGADDQAKGHGSTCESGPMEKGDGSFSTSHQPASASSEALAHLKGIAQELKKRSPNTSRRSTSRTSATVTRLKF